MSRKSLKLAMAALVVAAGTAAPVSVRVTPAALAGDEPLVRVNHACAATADQPKVWPCLPKAGYICFVDQITWYDQIPVFEPG
jgi:hypothetical protein